VVQFRQDARNGFIMVIKSSISLVRWHTCFTCIRMLVKPFVRILMPYYLLLQAQRWPSMGNGSNW